MTWRAAALSLGWSSERVEAFLEGTDAPFVEVLLVTADVLALRVRGARQCTYRDESIGCVARAAKIVDRLPEYIRPVEFDAGWCSQRGCRNRALGKKLCCAECLETLLATHCALCGRPLIDAESVELGIGPICRKMYRWAEGPPGNREAANRLIRQVSCRPNASTVSWKITALRTLGYTRIADRLLERRAW